MRRMLAVALLSVFSLSLIPVGGTIGTDSKLPPCCRRDGKHKCAMMDAAKASVGPGASIEATKSKCPLFPIGKSSAATQAFDATPPIRFAVVVNHEPNAVSQADALYRTSYCRTRQKRGPPLLHS